MDLGSKLFLPSVLCRTLGLQTAPRVKIIHFTPSVHNMYTILHFLAVPVTEFLKTLTLTICKALL
jgi:hypothetical protein